MCGIFKNKKSKAMKNKVNSKLGITSERIQFVLERRHTTLLDEMALGIKKAYGYKPSRSRILRSLLNVLTDSTPRFSQTPSGVALRKALEAYLGRQFKKS